MAQIIRSGSPILNEEDLDQAIEFAINYWEDLAKEKMFPIAFWEVKQMLTASRSNEIALRITNIEDPESISATWMVFEQFMADTLRDPVEPGVYYFILDDTLFYGPVLIPSTPVTQAEGISKASESPENSIIRGRIGRDPATGSYHAFFQAAECILIDEGGGGGGILTGAKVPPNS